MRKGGYTEQSSRRCTHRDPSSTWRGDRAESQLPFEHRHAGEGPQAFRQLHGAKAAGTGGGPGWWGRWSRGRSQVAGEASQGFRWDPRQRREFPLLCLQAIGHRDSPGWPNPPLNALTTSQTSDTVTNPPDRPPLVRPASGGDSPAEQSVRNSPLGHTRHQHRLLQVRARLLLENGIVRAKSQCGQFIRFGSPEWMVCTSISNYAVHRLRIPPRGGEMACGYQSSSQNLVTL